VSRLRLAAVVATGLIALLGSAGNPVTGAGNLARPLFPDGFDR
jgi:hypothetical protein